MDHIKWRLDATPKRQLQPRWHDLPWVTLAVLAGAALRLHGLGTVPLDFDEGATWYFAHLPLADLWGKPARLELNPPLYYTIEGCVVALAGASAASLRIAGVASGVLCIVMTAQIARRVSDRPASIMAAWLVACSAVCIGASQDARCYATLTLACLAAIDAMVFLFDHCSAHQCGMPGRRTEFRARWAQYVLSCIAALYLHGTGIVVVACLNGVAVFAWTVMLGRPRRLAWQWIAANVLVAVAYAPWLPVAAEQSLHQLADFWLPVPRLADLYYAMLNVYALPTLHVFQPMADAVILLAGIAGICFCRRRIMAIALALLLIGVPALSWIISQWRPIMNGKTLLWLTPIFLVLVAMSLPRSRKYAWPVLLVLLTLQGAATASFFDTRFDEGFPDVATTLRERVRAGDALFLDPPSSEILLAIYGFPRDRLTLYAQPGPDPWYRSFDGIFIDADALPDRHCKRLWVLTRAKPATQSMVEHDLASTMMPVSDQAFGKGKLRGATPHNLRLTLFTALRTN